MEEFTNGGVHKCQTALEVFSLAEVAIFSLSSIILDFSLTFLIIIYFFL